MLVQFLQHFLPDVIGVRLFLIVLLLFWDFNLLFWDFNLDTWICSSESVAKCVAFFSVVSRLAMFTTLFLYYFKRPECRGQVFVGDFAFHDGK